APSGPRLAFAITRADEEHILLFGMTRLQDAHRARLGKAGEVVEVALLAIAILDVVGAQAFRRGGGDRPRVRPHRVPHAAAPLLEDAAIHARLRPSAHQERRGSGRRETARSGCGSFQSPPARGSAACAAEWRRSPSPLPPPPR